MEVARAATSETAKKKRKVNTNGESVELPSSYAQLKKPRLLVVSGGSKIAAAEGVREVDEDVSTSDHVETSCCSSNGSSELVHNGDIKFVDLKKESEQVGSWKYNSSRERREMTAPISGIQAEAEFEEVESTVTVRSKDTDSRRRSAPPMESELEEFFTAAEKNIQKQFMERYNYDIAKDEPAEGRYEWVRLKP
ncbi:cyclin-dependent kinase inhibitor 7 isoform X2 [Prunus yedoensis var. nudiflora]|uniref:Cyclin-dependent kinase inhibitor n=1 Tax=Prunus yedoensis var. nudiflora TaxID=2094558 RepID=A0A314YBX0_PRUYE|nr:cyclin-dependent kinase inhibitor 7 isoform X2 [Prunus yedoensis var. nudiflora]